MAIWNVELTRAGPGLVLRDILSGQDAQVAAVAAGIAALDADVLLLTGIDHDHDLRALVALADRVAERGVSYPYRFALRPNTGVPSGLDLDGNGRSTDPRDAWGYGRFPGQAGMGLLSRLPVQTAAARDFTAFAWRDLPGAILPPDLPPEVARAHPLHTTAAWEVPVTLPDGRALRLLAWYASPPVFDGAEDRNGRRNHDETAFWLRLLDGSLPFAPPAPPFVILGQANLDPVDGDGRRGAIRALLDHPALQDPAPRAPRGAAAQDAGQNGDPALDTAGYGRDIGGLRVDYILPDRGLRVMASGVARPDAKAAAGAQAASRHWPVWVDLDLPAP